MNADNFDEYTVDAISLAREEARRLGCAYVDQDLLLLGIIKQGTGYGAIALQMLTGNLADVRTVVEAHIPPGYDGELRALDFPFTLRGKRVLDLSIDIADELQHDYVGTEHLLLGYLREGYGSAMGGLSQFGVTFGRARKVIMRLLQGPTSDHEAIAEIPEALSASIEVRLADGSVVRHECVGLREAFVFLARNGIV